MIHALKPSRCSWLDATPPRARDIRRLYAEFPSETDAERERTVRVSILRKGRSHSSAKAAELLSEARKAKPAMTGCCPLLARQFQIWFVDAALTLDAQVASKGQPYTILDLNEAVNVGALQTIDWRRLHATLRKRIVRVLGEDVVVIGFGEVEFDASRNKWQPHYHLMAYRASPEQFRKLRKKHYPAKRRGPRPMVRSSQGEPALWFSYMSKLVSFGKVIQASGHVQRVRLTGRLSREYFRYLASRAPTSFVFCVNCSVAKARAAEVLEKDYEGENIDVRRPVRRIPLSRRALPS